jgi:hypothetical protein
MVVQVLRQNETSGESEGKTFETLGSVDSAILTKVYIKYSNWLPVVLSKVEYRCSCFIRVSSFFIRIKYWSLPFVVFELLRVPGRCYFVLCCCTLAVL